MKGKGSFKRETKRHKVGNNFCPTPKLNAKYEIFEGKKKLAFVGKVIEINQQKNKIVSITIKLISVEVNKNLAGQTITMTCAESKAWQIVEDLPAKKTISSSIYYLKAA